MLSNSQEVQSESHEILSVQLFPCIHVRAVSTVFRQPLVGFRGCSNIPKPFHETTRAGEYVGNCFLKSSQSCISGHIRANYENETMEES